MFEFDKGIGDWVSALALSPEGDLLASREAAGHVRVWSVRGRNELVKLPRSAVNACLAFSPQGK